jgi:uncharacterized protein (UPF0262 family)
MSANHRLTCIHIDEATLGRGGPDVEHERRTAIFDLLEENSFAPAGLDESEGPFSLMLSLTDNRLVFEVRRSDESPLIAHVLALGPFRRIIKDYLFICDSYHQAIRSATLAQIEAIDMGRRGVHNDGAELLRERLDGKVKVDALTARRLFTLIVALHWKADAQGVEGFR